MPASLLMGIDLGTSSVKTMMLDNEGHILKVASREYDIITPKPGWAEHNPETWFQPACETIRWILADTHVSPTDIAAIGLSGMMHGTVCLDAHGGLAYPAIIWADQRSQEQVEWVYRKLGNQRLGQLTGNPLATGFMLATWLWLRENDPDVCRVTATLLLPKDYLRYRLTGVIGSEPSDASSTLLFDTANRCWSTALLESLDINPRLLPPIHESFEICGGLLKKVAQATGLVPGTPVVFGGSDQACQALGHGAVEPGVLSSTIGTGGQLLAPTLQPRYDPEVRIHLFCHALPRRWHLEAATLSAGLSFKWLRDQLLLAGSYQELADLGTHAPAGAEGLFFAPYLLGERTPHMDPGARATFTGLTLRHQRAHLVRAVMEGVVFSLKQGLDLMIDLGVNPETIVASGGATSHPLWLQLQADIYNRPIHRTTTIEAAALGAALLAGVGVGFFTDVQAACQQVVRFSDEAIYPNSRNVSLYAEIYPVYCRIYPTFYEKSVNGLRKRA